MKYEAIVIGASAGGINAVQQLLKNIKKKFTMPIIIVQHIHAHSDNYLVQHLNTLCPLQVKEAEEKEIIAPGTVYIAPANYHLLIDEGKSLSLSIDEKVNFSRPSIDVLFESAADVYKEKLIAIILTGANSDGTDGMKRVRENGGLLIVQNPQTAEVASMPLSVVRQLQIDFILNLQDIAPFLTELDNNRSKQ